MTFWVFLFGLIGARLFYCFQYWGRDINSLWDVLQYWKGGIVYYGGILGASVGVLRLSPLHAVSIPAFSGCAGAGDRGREACSDVWDVS